MTNKTERALSSKVLAGAGWAVGMRWAIKLLGLFSSAIVARQMMPEDYGLVAIALVVAASHVLIPAIKEAAERMGVPSGIVAATLVAFGTSLPELVTAVTAALKKHGDLAVGNVIGADILNVLFVAGASAAVTPAGLDASPSFFRVLFPGMLLVLIVFRVGVFVSKDEMKRGFGVVLIVIYVAVMTLSYTMLGTMGGH